MLSKVFQLLLIFSVISVGANVDMDTFDLIFFRTGIIVLFAASLMDKPKREMPGYLNKAVFSLLVLLMLNLFTMTFAHPVMVTILNFFLAILGFYIVHNYWDASKSIKWPLFIAASINIIFALAQRARFDPVFDKLPIYNQPQYAGAFLGNNPRLASYLALLLPFLPLWLTVIIGALIYLLVKQMIIAIPIIVVILSRLKNIKLRIGFVMLLTLIVIIFFRENIVNSWNTRIAVWKPALEIYFDRPLLGYGLGVKILPYTDAYFSSYLYFIIGTGVLGLAWLCYAFRSILNKLSRSKETLAFITLALLMFIEYPFEIRRLWFTLIAILAMTVINFKKEAAI